MTRMKTNGRRPLLSLVAMASAAALALTACSGDGGQDAEPGSGDTVDPDEQITLTMYWWGNDDRADRYNQAIELFEAEYSNITVQANFSSWDDYWPARATEAAGSSLPDVFQMDLAYLSQYGGRDQLLDLTPYLGGELDVSGMSEELVDAGRVGEGLYGIAQGTNTLALFANPAIIEQLGVGAPTGDMSWNDYAQWMAEAADAGAGESPALYGSYDFTGVFWLFIQYMVQNGNEVFTADGDLAFTEDDVLGWLDITAELRAAGQVHPAERAAQLDPLDGFSAQEVATSATWDNFLAMYYADTGADQIDILPVPIAEGSTERGLFQKPAMLLSAAANTAHPEAAAALVSFITNDPGGRSHLRYLPWRTGH